MADAQGFNPSQYGPQALPHARRSQYLAAALQAMAQSGENIRSPGELGTRLLAQAVANWGQQRNDARLAKAQYNDSQAANAPLIAGLQSLIGPATDPNAISQPAGTINENPAAAGLGTPPPPAPPDENGPAVQPAPQLSAAPPAASGMPADKTALISALMSGGQGAAEGPKPGFTFAPPVNAPVTSGFGHRSRPRPGATSEHPGVDYGTPMNTGVAAAGNGRVTFAGPRGGYGNMVIVEHPDGTESRYAHLDSIGVQEGDGVMTGQPLGQSGRSGVTTGPNMHFETRRGGGAVNPRSVLGTSFTPNVMPTAPQDTIQPPQAMTPQQPPPGPPPGAVAPPASSVPPQPQAGGMPPQTPPQPPMPPQGPPQGQGGFAAAQGRSAVTQEQIQTALALLQSPQTTQQGREMAQQIIARAQAPAGYETSFNPSTGEVIYMSRTPGQPPIVVQSGARVNPAQVTVNGVPGTYDPRNPGQITPQQIPSAMRTQDVPAEQAGFRPGTVSQQSPTGERRVLQAPPDNYQPGPGGYAPIPGSAADPRNPMNRVEGLRNLRQEVAPILTAAGNMRRNIDAVRTGYQQQNGAGDIAMVNGLQRLIDDGVVREGDVALQLQAQGINGGIAGLMGFLQSSGRFDANIRRQLLNTSNALYTSIEPTFRDRVLGFRATAENTYGPGSFAEVVPPETLRAYGWEPRPQQRPQPSNRPAPPRPQAPQGRPQAAPQGRPPQQRPRRARIVSVE